ncbi:MAG: DUF1330 domain-containing protein [Acidimicrobiia bacterium]|nr:DUF1330 domain-containing protein [Acidimicrobiia bacterium]
MMSSLHYLVFQVDPETEDWIPGYQEAAPAALAAHGGRYLSLTPSPERLEGEGNPPSFMAIVEFPSSEAAASFYNSDEYRPHRDARIAGARNAAFSLVGMEPS